MIVTTWNILVKAHLNQHVELGNKIREAISTCRNTEYKVEQSVSLYPTSGYLP